MHSFTPDICTQMMSHTISRALTVIAETRGKQELYERQKPEILENLKQVAVIESTESSNRLEGITVAPDILDRIIKSRQPIDAENRSQGEIAGYRKVLGDIHEHAEHIPLNTNIIRQFHRDLMDFTPNQGGSWKTAPNDITETHPDGTVVIRAKTTKPYLVEDYMAGLVAAYHTHLGEGKIDPLILIALFVLDFLSIHPFGDGNGRMARLLTVLMLHHQNYRMARYISLERIIEESKDNYYDTLNASDRGWHDSDETHNPIAWVEYFLAVLVKASGEFTDKVDTIASSYGAKKALVIDAVENMGVSFSIAELARKCPSVGRDTLRANLNILKKNGYLQSVGRGRKAKWHKTGKKLVHQPRVRHKNLSP